MVQRDLDGGTTGILLPNKLSELNRLGLGRKTVHVRAAAIRTDDVPKMDDTTTAFNPPDHPQHRMHRTSNLYL
jgi:hypothetical protein